MTIFVDASALVAIIESEPGYLELLARLDTASRRLWSATCGWETVSALQSSYARPVDVARERMASYADTLELEMVGIGQTELATALDAYQRYGKGRHRARLNFGDCFAYACAKTNSASLLYKGGDFAYTDLA